MRTDSTLLASVNAGIAQALLPAELADQAPASQPEPTRPMLAALYSDEQPRDDHGRWSGGGGGATGNATAPKPAAEPGSFEAEQNPVQVAMDDYRDHGTKAAAFKQWFGDWENDPADASKVVDPQGEPQATHHVITVYHGTGAHFHEFSKQEIGQHALFAGTGFYFSENPEIAKAYAEGRKDPRVVPAYLNIRNPFDFDARFSRQDMEDWKAKLSTLAGDDKQFRYPQTRYWTAMFEEKLADERRFANTDGSISGAAAWSALRESLHEKFLNDRVGDLEVNKYLAHLGYDGLTHQSQDRGGTPYQNYHKGDITWGRIWVAFEPTQIKSIENRGTFDRKNPSIMLSAIATAVGTAVAALYNQNHDERGRFSEGGGGGGGTAVAEPQRKSVEAAEQDYRQNGTRSQAFRQWFGDWMNNPVDASKVVKESGMSWPTHEPAETTPISGEGSHVVRDGEPVAVYHGTATGGFEEFKNDNKDANALYGPGFYFTENKDIAAGYTDKGREAMSHPTIAQAEVIENKLRDMMPPGYSLQENGFLGTHKPTDGQTVIVTPKGQQEPLFIRSHLDRLLDGGYSRDGLTEVWGSDLYDTWPREFGWDANQIASFRDVLKDNGVEWSRPEVKQVYLNIRNPFRVDEFIEPQKVRDIFGPYVERSLAQKYGDSMKDGKYDGEIVYDKGREEYLDTLGPRNVIGAFEDSFSKRTTEKLLRAAGYDGITHIGGAITGNKPHRVWIAFEPTQIKAVDNRGTFDPHDPKVALVATHQPSHLAALYSEDEPRDDHGRWEGGGGDSAAAEPPAKSEPAKSAADPGSDRFGWALKEPVPAEPGTVPLPPNQVRLYHYTMAAEDTAESMHQAAEDLRHQGLDITKAKGHTYGEPDVVWASSQQPSDGKVYAEFGVDRNDPRWLVGKIDPNMSTADYEKRGYNSFFTKSIEPGEILAVHEPWHDKYRYIMAHPDLIKQVKHGDFDWMLEKSPGRSDMADYAPAVYRVKHETVPEASGLAVYMAIRTGMAALYSEDEARDEHGRWEGGGGTVAEPPIGGDPHSSGKFDTGSTTAEEALAQIEVGKTYEIDGNKVVVTGVKKQTRQKPLNSETDPADTRVHGIKEERIVSVKSHPYGNPLANNRPFLFRTTEVRKFATPRPPNAQGLSAAIAAAVGSAIAALYSEDEPRDEHGRWSGGGGAGAGAAVAQPAHWTGGGAAREIPAEALTDVRLEAHDFFPEGPRHDEAQEALKPSKYDLNLAKRAASGKLVAVASIWKTPDTAEEGVPPGQYLRVGNMATIAPTHDYGTKMFQDIIDRAASQNAGIYLSSLEASRGFYEKLGMHEGVGATYYLTPDETKDRASGRPTPPPAPVPPPPPAPAEPKLSDHEKALAAELADYDRGYTLSEKAAADETIAKLERSGLRTDTKVAAIKTQIKALEDEAKIHWDKSLALTEADPDRATRKPETWEAVSAELALAEVSTNKIADLYGEINKVKSVMRDRALKIVTGDRKPANLPVTFLTPRATAPDKGAEAVAGQKQMEAGAKTFAQMIGGYGYGVSFYGPVNAYNAEEFHTQYGMRSGRSFSEHESIYMAPNAGPATTIHELGHVLEFRDKDIHQRALAFLDRRTAGEPLKPMAELTGNKFYDANEKSRPDKFYDPYVGKDYNRTATEVVSMGMEQMFRDPVLFAGADRDHFTLIHSIMHLYDKKG